MIAQLQFDAQLRRLASALDTSVEDLLLHAPAAWWGAGDASWATEGPRSA